MRVLLHPRRHGGAIPPGVDDGDYCYYCDNNDDDSYLGREEVADQRGSEREDTGGVALRQGAGIAQQKAKIRLRRERLVGRLRSGKRNARAAGGDEPGGDTLFTYT